jgi:hypothetical protein
MTKTLFILMSLFCLVAQPLLAINARSYDDALKKGKNRPVVFFCYGANIDRANERAFDEFIKQRKLMPFVRDCVFLQVPIYQLPDEKEKKEVARIMGKDRGMPSGIRSLPCLLLLDGDGNLRGSVQDHVDMKDPETAGAALALIIDAYGDQEKLLKKARGASGKRQTGALAEAADMKDVRMPGNPLGNGGNTGLGSLATNATGMLEVGQKMQEMSLAEAARYMRSLIADGYYSRRQRQEILAAYSGHVRRNGGSAARLRAIYYEMRNIDPTSIYGAYAEGAIKLWVEPREAAGEPAYQPKPSTGKTALGDTKKQ